MAISQTVAVRINQAIPNGGSETQSEHQRSIKTVGDSIPSNNPFVIPQQVSGRGGERLETASNRTFAPETLDFSSNEPEVRSIIESLLSENGYTVISRDIVKIVKTESLEVQSGFITPVQSDSRKRDAQAFQSAEYDLDVTVSPYSVTYETVEGSRSEVRPAYTMRLIRIADGAILATATSFEVYKLREYRSPLKREYARSTPEETANRVVGALLGKVKR